MRLLLLLYLVILSNLSFAQTYYELEAKIERFFQLNEIDRARTYLDSVMLVEPKCVSCHLHKAQIAFHDGQHRKARLLIQKTIGFEVDHISFRAYILDGEMYEIDGELQQAQIAYNKALAINPNSATAMTCKGTILQKMGQDDAAEPLIRRALEIEPNNPRCIFNATTWHLKKLNFEEALHLAQRLTDFDYLLPRAFYFTGEAYMQIKVYDSAIFYFEKAASLGNESIKLEVEYLMPHLKKQINYVDSWKSKND